MSRDGINYRQLPAISNNWRSIAFSPELSQIVCVSSSGTNRLLVSPIKSQLPTNRTVFNSLFNSIDISGNWLFKQITTSERLVANEDFVCQKGSKAVFKDISSSTQAPNVFIDLSGNIFKTTSTLNSISFNKSIATGFPGFTFDASFQTFYISTGVETRTEGTNLTDLSGANNIRYNAIGTRKFLFNFSICAYHTGGSSQELIVRPFVNNTVVSNVEALVNAGNNDQLTGSFSTILTLSTGDVLQMRGQNTAGSREWFFSNYSLTLLQL
jgi:hypothetical protein